MIMINEEKRDKLLTALNLARSIIQEDRDTTFDCHKNPETETVEDELGKEDLQRCNAALVAIDAALEELEPTA